MPRITLPDGSVRAYDHSVTPADVAADIGPGLAKAAVGARINGELADLSAPITEDATLGLVTDKPRDDQGRADLLFLLRHSAAHVMAEAIQRLIPEAQLVYGPPVENGFYYDIAFPESRPLREGDFEAIETEMAKIIAENRAFTRYEMPITEGTRKLKTEGSKYKLDNAERAVAAGSDTLSFYATGEPRKDWEDLCRGPHVPSTGRIGAIKIMSLASSYWHGDENSDRLTRVYGTAFPSQKELDAYLSNLEEAKKRDHRVLGKKLGLFHIDEMVGQGLVLWSPKGSIIRQSLQDFIGQELRRQGYSQVFTPHIGKLDLYRTSGHFPYYKDSQYPPIVERETMELLADEGCTCAELTHKVSEGEIEGYMLKPMNCPMHARLYRSTPHSYRDLPVRLAEFGTVYRWEQSGELSGMTRVRGFTQDDAHLFCTEDQVAGEIAGCLELVKIIFATLGMSEYRVRLGMRDPDASKYIGEPEQWDKAENALRDAAKTLGVPYTEEPGEAAFYGPKIDFVVRDVIGREWQLGTVQVDYIAPVRFDLTYVGADNQTHRPVMIHRAPFGSMERFTGVLIEHFEGAFPVWLSPEMARVLPISEKSAGYAAEVHAELAKRGLRVGLDASDERIQAKVKVGAEEKIPYLIVVGPRDAEARVVSIRARGIQKDLGTMPLSEFADALEAEASSRGASSVLERFQTATA